MSTQKDTEKKPLKKKAKKKKGPLRLEAIVPALIIVALFWSYFYFFFDSHLRWGLQYAATQAHGAEVNIGNLRTSFWNASLKITKIELTSPSRPEKNTLEVGEVQFKANWGDLLKGKLIIPLASINSIQVDTTRRRPGRVLKSSEGSNQMLESVKSDTLAETEKQLDGNIFGDVAKAINSEDLKKELKAQKNDFKTVKWLKEMEVELKQKEKQWKERIKSLPNKDDIKSIEADVKALKVNSKDPTAIISAISKADKIIRQVKSDIKAVDGAQKELKTDLKKYKSVKSTLNKMVDEDLDELLGKMGLPSLDPSDLAMKVFGRQVSSQVKNAEKYVKMAEKYMPPPKKKAEETAQKPTAPRRAGGKVYRFPKPGQPPKLWVKKVAISSKSNEDGFSGDIAGEVLDITNNPKHLGRPMKVNIDGDFPKSQIYGVEIRGVVDHTTDEPVETVDLKVGTYPLTDLELSKSSDLTYGFKKATGSSSAKLTHRSGLFDFGSSSVFSKIDYLVEAKDDKTEEIVTNISKGLGEIDLRTKVTGTWSSPKLSLRSNLGERFQKALKGEFSNQLKQYKQQARQLLMAELKEEANGVLGQVDEFEKITGGSLQDSEQALAGVQGQIDKEKRKLKAKEGDKLKEAGKKLLKGLKLKF